MMQLSGGGLRIRKIIGPKGQQKWNLACLCLYLLRDLSAWTALCALIFSRILLNCYFVSM